MSLCDPCAVNNTAGDLPWPLSVKLVPEDEERRQGGAETDVARKQAELSAEYAGGKTKLCQAWFSYRGEKKMLQWAGPNGGNELIETIRKSFRVGPEKLIYLSEASSRDVIDVDSALPENFEYLVRIEPEDAGPFNIVPCLLNICTFNYARNGGNIKNDG